MVAKHGHLACDQSPNPEIGESGSDNKQVLKPLINFRAIGTGFFLLLKSPRRIDKILLNTWRRIAQEVDASKVLPEKMADVVYAASKEDGRSCWTLHCPHCVVAQPDVWLNPSPSGTVKADAGYAMQIEPHLTVVPTLGNQPSLSGLAFTQLMVRFA
jgi:hypothetical protein